MAAEPIIIKTDDVKEEQIWGKSSTFFEKKLYRDDKIAINLRRVPAQAKVGGEGGYQFHTHGDSMEICYHIAGKHTGYSEIKGLRHGGKGELAIIPPNTKHGVVSVEEEQLILAIFIPPPKEKY